MPVPVSPCKSGSSQEADASTPESEEQNAPYSPPTEEEGEIVDPDVLAGYQDCLKETLRFLLEEEDLPADHPVVMGLATHLTREHAHTELTKILQQFADSVTTADVQVQEMSSSSHVNTLKVPMTLNVGFEVTLVEDDDNDEGLDDDEVEAMDEEYEYVDVEEFSDSEDAQKYESGECEEDEITDAIMQDPELQQQLIRFVYQGCNLLAAPHPLSQALHHGLVSQL